MSSGRTGPVSGAHAGSIPIGERVSGRVRSLGRPHYDVATDSHPWQYGARALILLVLGPRSRAATVGIRHTGSERFAVSHHRVTGLGAIPAYAVRGSRCTAHQSEAASSAPGPISVFTSEVAVYCRFGDGTAP